MSITCGRSGQRFTCHFLRYVKVHQLQQGRRDIAQPAAVLQRHRFVGDVDQWNIVEGVSRHHIAVFIQHHVCIAVVRCQQYLRRLFPV